MCASTRRVGQRQKPWKPSRHEGTMKATHYPPRKSSDAPCAAISTSPIRAYSQEFQRDQHIPNLLAFHPSIRFTEEPLYLSGKLILQDKASCFPAHILSPPSDDNAVVIDATAAPGNKTSHLCAIMQNKGKVCCCYTLYFCEVT